LIVRVLVSLCSSFWVPASLGPLAFSAGDARRVVLDCIAERRPTRVGEVEALLMLVGAI